VSKSELARGLDAVHHRKRDVHPHDIGEERLGELDALATVAGCAYDFQPAVRFQQFPQRLGERPVILDHEHPPTARTGVAS
jgi:hypothetical protein